MSSRASGSSTRARVDRRGLGVRGVRHGRRAHRPASKPRGQVPSGGGEPPRGQAPPAPLGLPTEGLGGAVPVRALARRWVHRDAGRDPPGHRSAVLPPSDTRVGIAGVVYDDQMPAFHAFKIRGLIPMRAKRSLYRIEYGRTGATLYRINIRQAGAGRLVERRIGELPLEGLPLDR